MSPRETARACIEGGQGPRRSPAWWLVMLALASCTGCATVAPWERGKIAHWTMTTNDLAGPAEEHVRAIHEGANGGGFEAGGGCGCN